MTPAYSILITFFCAFLSAISQIWYKKGSDDLKFDMSILKNYYILAGLGLYGVSAVIFILALKEGELSVLYPIMATSYIWVSLLATRFLNEKMNFYKWAGIALIITGVLLISII